MLYLHQTVVVFPGLARNGKNRFPAIMAEKTFRTVLKVFTRVDSKCLLPIAVYSISKVNTDLLRSFGSLIKIMEVHTGKICLAINSPLTSWLISGQHLSL